MWAFDLWSVNGLPLNDPRAPSAVALCIFLLRMVKNEDFSPPKVNGTCRLEEALARSFNGETAEKKLKLFD